jgi:hypothetical protein
MLKRIAIPLVAFFIATKIAKKRTPNPFFNTLEIKTIFTSPTIKESYNTDLMLPLANGAFVADNKD